jgi:hypothetical protein
MELDEADVQQCVESILDALLLLRPSRLSNPLVVQIGVVTEKHNRSLRLRKLGDRRREISGRQWTGFSIVIETQFFDERAPRGLARTPRS